MTTTWYEVKMVRKAIQDEQGPTDGWLAVGLAGIPYFWQRDKHDRETPNVCRFASFEDAERAIEAYDANRGPTSRSWYEIHFPVRRVNGRKRPLLKGDAEIVKSA